MSVQIFVDRSVNTGNGCPIMVATSTYPFAEFVIGCAKALKPQLDTLVAFYRSQDGRPFVLASPEGKQAIDLSRMVNGTIPWLFEVTAYWYHNPVMLFHLVGNEDIRRLIELFAAYDELLVLLDEPWRPTTRTEWLVKLLERRESSDQEREAKIREAEIAIPS